MIVDDEGREMNHFIGPYEEGSSVKVSCEVSGGKNIIKIIKGHLEHCGFLITASLVIYTRCSFRLQ